jgi:hypothetical protein
MKIYALGIDLGNTAFHLVGLDSSGQVVVRIGVTHTTARLHWEFAGAVDRHGSLQWSTFPGEGSASARARRALDAGSVCEAVCDGDNKNSWGLQNSNLRLDRVASVRSGPQDKIKARSFGERPEVLVPREQRDTPSIQL